MTKLSPAERKFLDDLKEYGRPRLLRYPTHPVVKDLAKRGYVVLHRALSGPLGVATGEEMASLSEAGEAALEEPTP